MAGRGRGKKKETDSKPRGRPAKSASESEPSRRKSRSTSAPITDQSGFVRRSTRTHKNTLEEISNACVTDTNEAFSEMEQLLGTSAQVEGEVEMEVELNAETGALVPVDGSCLNGIYGNQIILTSDGALSSLPQDTRWLSLYSVRDIFSLDPNHSESDGVCQGLSTDDLNEIQSVGIARSTVWRNLLTQNNLIDSNAALLEQVQHLTERNACLTECVGQSVDIRNKVEKALTKNQTKMGPLERENQSLLGRVSELIAERDRSETLHKAEIKANEQKNFHEQKYTEALDSYKSQREKRTKELEATLKATKKELDSALKLSRKEVLVYKKKVVEVVKNDVIIDHKLCRKEFAALKCMTLFVKEFCKEQYDKYETFLNYLEASISEGLSVQSEGENIHWEKVKQNLQEGSFSEDDVKSFVKVLKKAKSEKQDHLKKEMIRKVRECFGQSPNSDAEKEANGEGTDDEVLPTATNATSLSDLQDKFNFRSPLLPSFCADNKEAALSKNILSVIQTTSTHAAQNVALARGTGSQKTVPTTAAAKSKQKGNTTGPKRGRGRPKNSSKSKEELLLAETEDCPALENGNDMPNIHDFLGVDQDDLGQSLNASPNVNENEKYKTRSILVPKRGKPRIKRKRNKESSSSEPTDESSSETDNHFSTSKNNKKRAKDLYDSDSADDSKASKSFPSLLRSKRLNANTTSISPTKKSKALSDSECEDVTTPKPLNEAVKKEADDWTGHNLSQNIKLDFVLSDDDSEEEEEIEEDKKTVDRAKEMKSVISKEHSKSTLKIDKDKEPGAGQTRNAKAKEPGARQTRNAKDKEPWAGPTKNAKDKEPWAGPTKNAKDKEPGAGQTRNAKAKPGKRERKAKTSDSYEYASNVRRLRNRSSTTKQLPVRGKKAVLSGFGGMTQKQLVKCAKEVENAASTSTARKKKKVIPEAVKVQEPMSSKVDNIDKKVKAEKILEKNEGKGRGRRSSTSKAAEVKSIRKSTRSIPMKNKVNENSLHTSPVPETMDQLTSNLTAADRKPQPGRKMSKIKESEPIAQLPALVAVDEPLPAVITTLKPKTMPKLKSKPSTAKLPAAKAKLSKQKPELSTPTAEPSTPKAAPPTPKAKLSKQKPELSTPTAEPSTPKAAPPTPKAKLSKQKADLSTPTDEPSTLESAPSTPKAAPSTPKAKLSKQIADLSTPIDEPSTLKSAPTPKAAPSTPKAKRSAAKSTPSTPKSASKAKLPTLKIKLPTIKAKAIPRTTEAKSATSVRARLGDPTIPIAVTVKGKSCQKSQLNEQIQKAVNSRGKQGKKPTVILAISNEQDFTKSDEDVVSNDQDADSWKDTVGESTGPFNGNIVKTPLGAGTLLDKGGHQFEQNLSSASCTVNPLIWNPNKIGNNQYTVNLSEDSESDDKAPNEKDFAMSSKQSTNPKAEVKQMQTVKTELPLFVPTGRQGRQRIAHRPSLINKDKTEQAAEIRTVDANTNYIPKGCSRPQDLPDKVNSAAEVARRKKKLVRAKVKPEDLNTPVPESQPKSIVSQHHSNSNPDASVENDLRPQNMSFQQFPQMNMMPYPGMNMGHPFGFPNMYNPYAHPQMINQNAGFQIHPGNPGTGFKGETGVESPENSMPTGGIAENRPPSQPSSQFPQNPYATGMFPNYMNPMMHSMMNSMMFNPYGNMNQNLMYGNVSPPMFGSPLMTQSQSQLMNTNPITQPSIPVPTNGYVTNEDGGNTNSTTAVSSKSKSKRKSESPAELPVKKKAKIKLPSRVTSIPTSTKAATGNTKMSNVGVSVSNYKPAPLIRPLENTDTQERDGNREQQRDDNLIEEEQGNSNESRSVESDEESSADNLIIDVNEEQLSETSLSDQEGPNVVEQSIILRAEIPQDINEKGVQQYKKEKMKSIFGGAAKKGTWSGLPVSCPPESVNVQSGRADDTSSGIGSEELRTSGEDQHHNEGSASANNIETLPTTFSSFDSPLSPCPSPLPADSMALVPVGRKNQNIVAKRDDDPVSYNNAKRLLEYHVLCKSMDELTEFTSVDLQIQELKLLGRAPSSYLLAKALYNALEGGDFEVRYHRPTDLDAPLRIGDHKILVFVQNLIHTESDLYGDLPKQMVAYLQDGILTNRHVLKDTDTVIKVGRFYGAFCRKFLSPEDQKDLIFACLYTRPEQASALTYGLLCSYSDCFSMLPDVFDYDKTTPCEKLMLFALQNPLRVYHDKTHVQLKSLLSQSLKHPPFDCTWDEMLKTTMKLMDEIESEEQIQSAVKGISMLLVQGGWNWFRDHIHTNLTNWIQMWSAGNYSDVAFAGFFTAMGRGAAKSDEYWDIGYLRSEVVRVQKLVIQLGKMEYVLESAFKDCLDSLTEKEAKMQIVELFNWKSASRGKDCTQIVKKCVNGKKKCYRRKRNKHRNSIDWNETASSNFGFASQLALPAPPPPPGALNQESPAFSLSTTGRPDPRPTNRMLPNQTPGTASNKPKAGTSRDRLRKKLGIKKNHLIVPDQ